MVPRENRGADEGGLPGLVRGAARGAVGALVLPLAAVLETSMRVADSIRSAVMGIPPLLPRARPPRHVAPDLPLAPYNWSEVLFQPLPSPPSYSDMATIFLLATRAVLPNCKAGSL